VDQLDEANWLKAGIEEVTKHKSRMLTAAQIQIQGTLTKIYCMLISRKLKS